MSPGGSGLCSPPGKRTSTPTPRRTAAPPRDSGGHRRDSGKETGRALSCALFGSSAIRGMGPLPSRRASFEDEESDACDVYLDDCAERLWSQCSDYSVWIMGCSTSSPSYNHRYLHRRLRPTDTPRGTT